MSTSICVTGIIGAEVKKFWNDDIFFFFKLIITVIFVYTASVKVTLKISSYFFFLKFGQLLWSLCNDTQHSICIGTWKNTKYIYNSRVVVVSQQNFCWVQSILKPRTNTGARLYERFVLQRYKYFNEKTQEPRRYSVSASTQMKILVVLTGSCLTTSDQIP